jgi:hypothetical protein
MSGLAAQSGVTTIDLQTVAAMVVVALLVALAFVVVYSVVAGGLASLVMLLIGLVRLLLAGTGRVWSGVRKHVHPGRISPESVPDLRVRPSG